jgi:hypothetical protein
MKNFRDSFINILQNEDIKRDIRELLRPVMNIFYNEIYIYIWFICIFILFLTFIILANLFLLLRIISKNSESFVDLYK